MVKNPRVAMTMKQQADFKRLLEQKVLAYIREVREMEDPGSITTAAERFADFVLYYQE
jgi:hypothetical protein